MDPPIVIEILFVRVKLRMYSLFMGMPAIPGPERRVGDMAILWGIDHEKY